MQAITPAPTHLLSPSSPRSALQNLPPVRAGARASLATLAIASSVLLGGCSIWPKALTFGASAEPAAAPATTTQAQPTAPAATPAPASAAVATPLEPRSAVTTTALADSPKEPSPTIAPSTTPAPMQAAPVEAPAHKATKPTKAAKAAKHAKASTAAKANNLVPGFYINVGLFGVPENGTKAYKKLEAAGLPVFSDGIKTKKGNLTRVRVGPFTTQAEADTAATQIQTLKLDAVVFKH